MIVSIVMQAIALYLKARGEKRVVREGMPSRNALRRRSGESICIAEVATEEAAPQRRSSIIGAVHAASLCVGTCHSTVTKLFLEPPKMAHVVYTTYRI